MKQDLHIVCMGVKDVKSGAYSTSVTLQNTFHHIGKAISISKLPQITHIT